MAHFNFVISQNAKWGHAGFYIDCHRMTVPENILLQKKHCPRVRTLALPEDSEFFSLLLLRILKLKVYIYSHILCSYAFCDVTISFLEKTQDAERTMYSKDLHA